jgi:hypothetical protein
MIIEEYIKGETVIVIGGTAASTGVTKISAVACVVEEVGEWDLLVKNRNPSATSMIVSKKICIPIRIDATTLASATPRSPAIGDMVYYKGKVSWRDKHETCLAGTIYEIRYADGSAIFAKVHSGEQMIDLPYSELMVLQRKK